MNRTLGTTGHPPGDQEGKAKGASCDGDSSTELGDSTSSLTNQALLEPHFERAQSSVARDSGARSNPKGPEPNQLVITLH